MGGELNHHPVPGVEPFGVMTHSFGDQGHAAHEAEGLIEIGKAQLAVEFPVDQGPVRQQVRQKADLFSAQRFNRHGWVRC